MKDQAGGFTLMQTLISLAVIAALLMLSLPSIKSSIASVYLSTARSDIIESLIASSRHALASQRHVVLCPSFDGASCTRDIIDWSNGWIAFMDDNRNREYDPSETLILAKPALKGKARLLSTTGRTRLTFLPRGDNSGSNVTFTLCNRRGATRAETLVLANTGRWRSTVASVEAAQACENSR